MATGVNKVILLGRVGRDPEVKSTPGGLTIVELSIATSEAWKDKQTGERTTKTEWHNLTFFGKVGEIAAQYVKKGSLIYVEGKLNTQKWQGKDGQKRSKVSIIVDQIQMLDSKNSESQQSLGQSIDRGQAHLQPMQQHAQQLYGSQPQGSRPVHDSFDDDVPF